MAEEALEKALKKILGQPVEKEEETFDEHSEIICKCYAVTEDKIKKAIRENNLKTVEEVTNYTKAGGGCGQCKGDIQAILDEYWKNQAIKKNPEKIKLTNLQKINLIQKVVNDEIAPEIEKDGGGIELIDIDLPDVIISLKGACLSCSVASFTIENIKRLISQRLGEEINLKLI
jgi:NifU-like protein